MYTANSALDLRGDLFLKLHVAPNHFPYPLDTPTEALRLPQVVPAAEDEVGPGVEGGAHPAQVAVAAGTLQTVLVPVSVQCLQHEAVSDLPVAAGAAPRLLSGLEGHERHTWQEMVRQMDSVKKNGQRDLATHQHV